MAVCVGRWWPHCFVLLCAALTVALDTGRWAGGWSVWIYSFAEMFLVSACDLNLLSFQRPSLCLGKLSIGTFTTTDWFNDNFCWNFYIVLWQMLRRRARIIVLAEFSPSSIRLECRWILGQMTRLINGLTFLCMPPDASSALLNPIPTRPGPPPHHPLHLLMSVWRNRSLTSH